LNNQIIRPIQKKKPGKTERCKQLFILPTHQSAFLPLYFYPIHLAGHFAVEHEGSLKALTASPHQQLLLLLLFSVCSGAGREKSGGWVARKVQKYFSFFMVCQLTRLLHLFNINRVPVRGKWGYGGWGVWPKGV